MTCQGFGLQLQRAVRQTARACNDEVVFIILIIGNVLKPLVQSCCIMAVYIMANQLGMALVSDEALCK